ncbi:MAG: hypothetical protein GXY91_00020 [Clostridia bacterium]|nr:hypothetical protein [Clostridia bacterium]
MKVPRFSRNIMIPVLFILNLLAWLYVYDEYMMSWLFVYIIYMAVAIVFTISAQLAFGRNRNLKDIGINVCLVLLLLVLAQRFLPMDKIEQGLVDNYYGYIKIDADLAEDDKAVRSNDTTLVVRNYQEKAEGSNQADKLEIFKEKKLIESITLSEAVDRISQLMTPLNQAEFNNIVVQDVRYVGVKKKGGLVSLIFEKGHVFFKYDLNFNENGFVWEKESYKFAGLKMPVRDDLYDEETNKIIKEILLKGDPEKFVKVEIVVTKSKEDVLAELKNLGYNVIAEEPLTVNIPFYEIANLAHEEYIKSFSIKQ